MGIDIYLEWAGMTEEDKKTQIEKIWSLDGGGAGYLREAYHGEPYATHILVREAFEAEDCKAEIPAEVMRERMTRVTEPVYGKTGGHKLAQALGTMLQRLTEDKEGYAVEGVCRGNGQTLPMTVEEAVTERAVKLYNATSEEIQAVKESFWAFVELAEQKEKETGKPCTVYASH